MNRLNPVHIRDGQSQQQRLPDQLRPDYARIDGRSFADLLRFAEGFAAEVKFYDSATNEADGDWMPFFSDLAGQLAPAGGHDGDLEPHAALFAAFLRLYRHAQQQLNDLAGVHRNFYYRDILQFEPLPAVVDRVFLLFELKKKIAQQVLKAGETFKAGKDDRGAPLSYALAEDIIINRARVASLRSVYIDRSRKNGVHIAPVADSADGLGAALPQNEPKWPPFGSGQHELAELGFAFAAPVLGMQEGERTITVELDLDQYTFSTGFYKAAEHLFRGYLTGDKGWLGPFSVTFGKKAGPACNHALTLTVTREQPAVVAYDPGQHGGGFETRHPLVQFVIDPANAGAGHADFRKVRIRRARISVDVKEIENLSMKNDLGPVDPANPFMPFGMSPAAGATFYLQYDEAFTKNLTGFDITVQWKKVPDSSLKSYYTGHYTELQKKITDQSKYAEQEKFYDGYGKEVTDNEHFEAELIIADKTGWTNTSAKPLFDKNDARARHVISFTRQETSAAKGGAPLSTGPRGRVGRLQAQSNAWATGRLRQMALLDPKLRFLIATGDISGAAPSASAFLEEGTVGLRLTADFLHRKYAAVYTKIVLAYSTGKLSEMILPNEPYTPLIENLRLGYSARSGTVRFSAAEENEFLGQDIEFFQIGAFGQRREHTFLRKQLAFVTDTNTYLLPPYGRDTPLHGDEGEFYIGIAEIEPDQHLTLLFQVAEGSANPQRQKQAVRWSMLIDNHWRDFADHEVVSDSTNGLLRSGIIKFAIPAAATAENTLLPAGLYWLRAAVADHTDAVCQILTVATNAAAAEFVDNNNDAEHLRTPLAAGTIQKMEKQASAVKSVSQPYASFGGRMAENDEQLARRASERLRHKERAVTLWDYERLVLENFPQVYKVKCLPHTSPQSASAPGHVTVVVIPDLVNRDAYNPLEPRLDLHTLTEIKGFLGKRSGFFQDAGLIHVENPQYDPVQVKAAVGLKAGCEYSYYKTVLIEDIKRFLSPWAFDSGASVIFGGHLHKSVLIKAVEDLDYIDFVEEFFMFQGKADIAAQRDTDMAVAASGKAILVSSGTHIIAQAGK